MTAVANFDAEALRADAAELVRTEAILLDEARWDEWLALYSEDCVFWVPAWRQDGTLVDNPRREVSHIYAVGRGALSDRIYRVRSSMAVSSVPMQRTTHILSEPRLGAASEPGELLVRTSWNSHVYFPRTRQSTAFFGHYEHRLVDHGEGWRIAGKKIVLQNDYIPTLMDFYLI
jgi:3-phenylpropionate/cinnamic acid dioxygenase small subunit